MLSTLLLLVLVLSGSRLLDQRASTPIDEAFHRALVTFAVVRGINAVVSVVQGTEVAVEPAGVGVVLTPGEVFDPVNDLIERFSWIMLAASTSLGAQKILLELGTGAVLQLATVLAIGVLLLSLWRPRSLQFPGFEGHSRKLLLNLALLVLFVRFAVPAVVLLNNMVYTAFLEERYQTSELALEQTRDEVEALSTPAPTIATDGNDEGLLSRLGRWYDRTTQNLDVQARIELYKDRLARASEHIIHLIVVFMLQTVVFPLLFMWLALRLLRALVAAL